MKSGLDTGTAPAGEAPKLSGFEPLPVTEIAKLFPQLEILEFIGKGGMGAVYKARQPALDRLVALKILPPTAASDPGFAERFNREGRALARLNHPNIVTVHDFGHAGNLHYLLMEFVDGGNLRQIERAGQFTPEQALAIVPQICEALQFAHNEGIVHRDIKPENILLDKKGRVKITDFGIAKMLGQAAEAAPLTGAGDVVGTPHYMAPEQIEKPLTVDHRADIYSLGVVFYEMLTGELPLGKFTPPSRKVLVDVRLDEIVLQALEKEPSLRYQQASQVKTAVETITNTPGQRPRASEPDPGPAAADALAQRILARDYVLNIGSCLNRGWALVRNDFWPLVGVTALLLALWSAATSLGQVTNSESNVKISTSVLGLLVSGPLMGGLCLYFLKKIRGEPVRFETAFSGFKSSFIQLVLAGFVMAVLTTLGFVCFILPGVYLLVAWMFTLPLVIDRRLDFWPAMRLSRQTISKHWWKFLGVLLVLALLNLGGIMACCLGVFVTFPISLAALMYAYEDIINSGTRIASPAEATPPVGR
jgi:serine/threonine protein kinase